MGANYGSGEEIRTREATVFLRLVQVSERTIGCSLVEPFGHALEDYGASLGRRDGSGLEFPIGLCIQMARVERKLVRLLVIV